MILTEVVVFNLWAYWVFNARGKAADEVGNEVESGLMFGASFGLL